MKIIVQLFFYFTLFQFTLNAQNSVDYSAFSGGAIVSFKTVEYIPNTSFCEYNIKHKPKPVKTSTLPPNISTPNDSLNYFLITEKLEFDHQGSRVALYKYFKVENGMQSKPFSMQLQKQGENWMAINHPELKSLEYLIRHLKYKMLYKFLEKGTNGDEAIDAIAKKCLSVEGTLNYQKLYEALKQEIDDKTPLAVRIAE